MIKLEKLSRQVADHLHGRIRDGALRSGSVLRETELAAELGVSRTPVREALRLLAADGLVEVRANRSAVVRSLPPDQLRHLFQVREALETLAVELAVPRLGPADFERLEALSRAADDPARRSAARRFDVDLHRTIARGSGNPLLAAQIERLHELVELVRDQVGDRYSALALAQRQHRKILDALRRRDVPGARRAMAEHLRSTCEIAVRSAEAAP